MSAPLRLRRVAALVLLAAVPLAFLGVFFVLPVSGMLSRGLWPQGSFDPGGVLEVLARPRVHRVVWFTLWSATVGTALSVLLGLPAAYGLYRLDVPGVRVVRAALLVPFVLPTVVVGVAFRELLGEGGPLGGLGLDGTPVAIVAALVFFNVAVVIRTVGTTWEALDPRPAEAAAALGATPLQVLRTVTLPALRPALVSATSVVFLFCATAFGVVLTLGAPRYSSLESEIYLLTTNLLDLQAAAALSLLQLLVVVVLLQLTDRLRAPASGGATPQARPRRPGPRDLPAIAVTLAVLLAIAVPMLTLVAGSLQHRGTWGWGNYTALDRAGRRGAGIPVTDALVNSLRTATDATWMALLLGLLVALVATRPSRSTAERRTRRTLDGLFMLPLGVSAVTVGFGFLITLDRPPLDLRDNPLLVPIAQALVALPLVVRVLGPALAGIDPRRREAAASLGAPPWRVLLTVDLPVVWRPLLVAAGFAFAVSLGEFGATSFLARADAPTLPVLIYRLLGRPGVDNYGMALAASVILACLTTTVVLVIERLRVPVVVTR